MRKLKRRERKLYRAGYFLGYHEGYLEGYSQGLQDGNPFNSIVKALSGVAKAITENPELMKKAKELLHKQEQDRLAKLYGNDTHYAVIDDLSNTTEEVNDNEN